MKKRKMKAGDAFVGMKRSGSQLDASWVSRHVTDDELGAAKGRGTGRGAKGDCLPSQTEHDDGRRATGFGDVYEGRLVIPDRMPKAVVVPPWGVGQRERRRCRAQVLRRVDTNRRAGCKWSEIVQSPRVSMCMTSWYFRGSSLAVSWWSAGRDMLQGR